MKLFFILKSSEIKKFRERGFTLIELMIGIALSMVIVIAASYIYLGTNEVQRTLFEKSFVSETAKYSMDIIGRDIENAGFYPAIRVNSNNASAISDDILIQNYLNPITSIPPAAPPPAAFNTGIFGCQASRYLPATDVCGAHTSTTTDADTLVVNYYSNDASGLDIGNRADCLRQDSANDVIINIGRRNATTITATPISPLFVSNRYTLAVTNSTQIEGADITNFSFVCNGNGSNSTAPASNVYYPLMAGIDQLRFYYLERANSAADSQFQRADGVTNWENVVAVRVCLLSRSLRSARLQGRASYTIADCDGVNHNYTDGIERQVFSQTFVPKNQSQILNP